MASVSGTKLTSAASERVVAICNGFGFKLLLEIVKPEVKQNILVSPLDLALALFMICNGAGGDTKQALKDVLETSNLSTEEINQASQSLLESLLSPVDGVVLTIANALWSQEGLRFSAAFAQDVRRFYSAEASSLDLGSPGAIASINKWAQEHTGGKIKKLLASSDLSAGSDCILTSAVYFKGHWTVPFPKSGTHYDLFHLPTGQSRKVPTMQRAGRYNYCQSSEFQAVSLPYGDGRLSMYIFLPAEHSSVTKLSQEMAHQAWEEWLTKFEVKQLNLALPRFKLTYEAEMSEPLGAVGLGIMFRNGADLGPMGLRGHYIEQFKHKAIAEVSEEGTEAAAITAVIMGRSLLPSLSMVVNRPFFWAIRDNTTGTLIFIGLVIDPGS